MKRFGRLTNAKTDAIVFPKGDLKDLPTPVAFLNLNNSVSKDFHRENTSSKYMHIYEINNKIE